ncbi:MAG: hypothetical protein NC335_05770, partial [Bacteroides sp.]|nr:hypothetical protein [Bacteroides sp.]
DGSTPQIRPAELSKPADLMDLPASRNNSVLPPEQPSLKLPSVEQPKRAFFYPDEAIQKSISKLDVSKINHIFENNRHAHHLEPLEALLGSRENVVKTAITMANGQYPLEGEFHIGINMYGYDVFLDGRIVDGIPRVGTMYRPLKL